MAKRSVLGAFGVSLFLIVFPARAQVADALAEGSAVGARLAGSGLFFVSDYQKRFPQSPTGGIQEAIDAACTLGSCVKQCGVWTSPGIMDTSEGRIEPSRGARGRLPRLERGKEFGDVGMLQLDNVHIYDFRKTGTARGLDWGANAALISTSFSCMNTAGGNVEIRIDTHGNNPVGTTLDLRNVRLNTRVGEGKVSVVLDPDREKNISGSMSWYVLCDDVDRDGLCDFDGATHCEKLRVWRRETENPEVSRR